MGEDVAQPGAPIPDLPAGLAEPVPPPPWQLIPFRPGDYGFPPVLVAGILLADLLILLLLTFAAWRVWLAVRPRPAAPVLPPPRTEALAALDSLGEALPEITVRDLASLVSATIRRFVDREYGIGLTTRTAEEFRAILSERPDLLPGRLSRDLLAFLERCDEVKFKPGADSTEEKARLWEDGRELVLLAPLPEPAPTEVSP